MYRKIKSSMGMVPDSKPHNTRSAVLRENFCLQGIMFLNTTLNIDKYILQQEELPLLLFPLQIV